MSTASSSGSAMDNAAWGAALKASHRARHQGLKARSIRAPEPEHLILGGVRERLDIRLTDPAINKLNMQHPAGAFDGWLWAIRHWCAVRQFTIDLADDVALPDPGEPCGPHSGRVVFRLRMLSALFGEEIRIGERLAAFIARHPWRRDLVPWLNVSGSGRARKFSGAFPLKTEDDWEMALSQHQPFVGELAQSFDILPRSIPDLPSGYALCRQFPVGVFDRDPKDGGWKLLCPKGKSAIDLIAVDRLGAVHLFELKKPGAIAVGALSELMFYAALMHEAMRGRLSFSAGKVDPASRVLPDDIRKATAVRAHLFVPDIHPLLAPELFADITALAQARGWSFSIDAPDMMKMVPSLRAHLP
jgi:hypothetical protein